MEGVRRGNFDDAEPESPYPGVVSSSFDSAGATVTRYRFAAGARFPRHRHDQEQLTMIVDGTVTFTVGDEEQQLGPGDWSMVPGGVEHGLRAGDTGAVFLAVVVPRRDHARAYAVVEEDA
ncbi:MAG TPA: cupin domain-containing protein [Solirubrobacteraceae bacterium]|jgi:quercetin dioxygenase-like cupin family protein|nr:cupin domain-containing protein [Solirubrobacteraceae bacterium]